MEINLALGVLELHCLKVIGARDTHRIDTFALRESAKVSSCAGDRRKISCESRHVCLRPLAKPKPELQSIEETCMPECKLCALWSDSRNGRADWFFLYNITDLDKRANDEFSQWSSCLYDWHSSVID